MTYESNADGGDAGSSTKRISEKLKEKNYVGFNSWIKGFPGSGKSVLLVYAVKRLLAEKAKKVQRL